MADVLRDMPDDVADKRRHGVLNQIQTCVHGHHYRQCKINVYIIRQIYVSTIPLLSNKELEELGVKTIGDRAVLRKRCRKADRGMFLQYYSSINCVFYV